MATSVLIQQATLDAGVSLVHKRYGTLVRAAYDPARIDRLTALRMLRSAHPDIAGTVESVRRPATSPVTRAA